MARLHTVVRESGGRIWRQDIVLYKVIGRKGDEAVATVGLVLDPNLELFTGSRLEGVTQTVGAAGRIEGG
ncbi:hypothetical protein D3C71_1750180 [compost metagenome]